MLRLHAIAVCALTCLLCLGCGKGDERTPFMNETLGAQGMAPSAVTVDTSVLADQTAYKPANPPNAAPADASGPGASSGGPEVEAIRKTIRDAAAPLLQMDFSALLDVFEAEQVEALAKEKSALIELGEKLVTFTRVARDKTGMKPDDAAEAAARKKAVEALAGSCKIELVDAENASVTLNLAKLMEASGSIGSAFGGPPAGQAVAAQLAATPIPPVRFHKTAAGWKVHLPGPVTPEIADAIKDTISVARDFFDKFTARVDEMKEVDQAGMTQAAMEVQTELAPQINALMQKWQKAGAAAGGASAEAPKPPPPQPAQQPPAEPRSPRSPRSP